MKCWSLLATTTLMLLAHSQAQAQRSSPSADARAHLQTQQSSESEPAANAPRLWSESGGTESSLLPQVEAVLADLRRRGGADGAAPDPEVVRISTDAIVESPSTRNGDCRFMERPGSRIRAERCYYPSDVERALDEYQFAEEIRYNREAWSRVQMEQQMQRSEAINTLRGVGR